MAMSFCFIKVSESSLQEIRKDSARLEEIISSENGGDNLTVIDKTWGGLMYLLTGSFIDDFGHPLNRIFFSGRLIDPGQDFGYGPAHYLNSREVIEIHKTLESLNEEELKNRYNPVEMMNLEVYPMVWDRGDEELEFLLESFQELKTIFRESSNNNLALISVLN